MNWFFIFFFISGFCSLVYQVAWLRIAMADFGVTTALISIVLSVFMGGLALGSWGAGRISSRLKNKTASVFLRLYAASEAIIGLSGIVVAPLLFTGHNLLASTASGVSWNSNTYYLASGVWITLSLLPFCTCMGATFPFAMASVRDVYTDKSESSFSFLYVANVFGAMVGTLLSAYVFIELLGFRGTMLVASSLNLLVAVCAICLSNRMHSQVKNNQIDTTAPLIGAILPVNEPVLLVLLFVTGFSSLAMEVIWTRQFVPFYGPVVYTFAIILVVYLLATLIGSRIYRVRFQHHFSIISGNGWRVLTVVAGLSALFPLLAADYRIPLGALRILFGIGPFCLTLGFLTPCVLDLVSSGDPGRAGFAYALNTVGCIIGPLVAGFLLLPVLGERWSLVLLSLPLFILGLQPGFIGVKAYSNRMTGRWYTYGVASVIALAMMLVWKTKDFETRYPKSIVLRDNTATVIAKGDGMEKRLLVNGISMTCLTPISKMMTHMPLAFLDRPPKQGLVLCLGMGTSYRSMLSWGIQSTVVELVPSIPSLLPFFHADGERMLSASNGRIVIDDARRFLERSSQKFDVIVLDPPPPIEAAASSLLYSREFYATVSKRLEPDGIFQQWIANNDPIVITAITKALLEEFPYVRVFYSVKDWGIHLLASNRPIKSRTPAELAAKLPNKAAADIVEWGPYATPTAQFSKVISQEVATSEILSKFRDVQYLSDNRPINEYYLLRSSFKHRF